MAKRHERTQARRMALLALYMSKFGTQSYGPAGFNEVQLPDEGKLSAYACELLDGVICNEEEINDKLASVSQNWAVERMPLVDHAILQIACFELLHQKQIPVSVCINEAVELAKEYGGEDESARFVNGVLGRLARMYAADRSSGVLPDEVTNQNNRSTDGHLSSAAIEGQSTE